MLKRLAQYTCSRLPVQVTQLIVPPFIAQIRPPKALYISCPNLAFDIQNKR